MPTLAPSILVSNASGRRATLAGALSAFVWRIIQSASTTSNT